MAEIENVMAKYAAGDDAQLAALYDLAAPALFAFLTRMARDRALAEDITHDTFLRVHAARGSYRTGARVMPWMYAIARRLFLDSLRSRKREGPSLDANGDRPSDPGIVSDAPGADELVAAERLAVRIEEVLRAMPENQSTAFRLLKQEHLSIAEAAAVLGTTETTVKLRAHRSYEALRKALGRDWLEREPGEAR
jgi:RNA polymerase sigma-70 factor, ECF subfamily